MAKPLSGRWISVDDRLPPDPGRWPQTYLVILESGTRANHAKSWRHRNAINPARTRSRSMDSA